MDRVASALRGAPAPASVWRAGARRWDYMHRGLLDRRITGATPVNVLRRVEEGRHQRPARLGGGAGAQDEDGSAHGESDSRRGEAKSGRSHVSCPVPVRQRVVLDVVDRLQQLDGRLAVERVARVADLEETLEVGWQLHAISNEQDEPPPVQGHCCPDLDEHVGVQDDVLGRLLVEQLLLGVHVDDGGACAPAASGATSRLRAGRATKYHPKGVLHDLPRGDADLRRT